MLVGPKVTRRLMLGDVYEPPDKAAMAVECKVVPKLAENAAAGKCRARLEGTIDAQQFYPASAKTAGIEGDAVVRYWVPSGSEAARRMPKSRAPAAIRRSTPRRSIRFAAANSRSDCDYGLSSIRIAFKLQD